MTDQRPFWVSHDEWARIQESGAQMRAFRFLDREMEQPSAPVTPEWVQEILDRIEHNRSTEHSTSSPKEKDPWDEDANERRIQLAGAVLRAIAEGTCADPAACAALVADFAKFTRPLN